MSIRFRGSILGNYAEPTTGGASGIYDLDAYSTFASLSSWPAGVAGLYLTPMKAIIGYGQIAGSPFKTAISNIISSAGVIGSDQAAAGSPRIQLGAAGYGTDKAVFAGGTDTSNSSLNVVNYVTNTGSVGADTTSTGPWLSSISGATYGLDKSIFSSGTYNVTGAGSLRAYFSRMSNTGAWISTVATTYYYSVGGAVGYGNDTAIICSTARYTTSGGGGFVSGFIYTYVSNQGTISAETGTANYFRLGLPGGASRYGNGTAFLYNFQTSGSQYVTYITNTGVIGSDNAVSLTIRQVPTATTYGGGSAIIVAGSDGTNFLSTVIYVNNTGTLSAETATSGWSNRMDLASAGFSLT